ncbi:retrovirus-related pol polyprotein from transposon TNT 1-94 [Trifolium medium]|uniref:Retrovirus-related pol polyprotein from transposon TNT 1-94 n=1 Tax=Trifolium medium TaxID=97028 RepID=A0A392R2N1_9FABA|nr:retrovirus-related pol polyprotein from transposon TNT 1-94 [Trifolium medium]
MRVVFSCQDVWDLVKNGVHLIIESSTDTQNATHKERKNRTIMNMMLNKEIEWCDSISHVQLKVFGSIAYRHVPDQLRKKLNDKGQQMIFVGYHFTGGYRL